MTEEPSDIEKREIAKDAARVVKSRLKTDPWESEAGIRFGKDQFGNYRFCSLDKREYNPLTKNDIPVEMIVTPEGKHLLTAYPSLLRVIDRGDFHPDRVFQTGSSAFVVHDRSFPDLAIKLLTFRPFVAHIDPNRAPEGQLPPVVQSATGIDHLYWKQALENTGINVPKPYLATQDIVVEEFIPGETFFDFLSRANQEITSNKQYEQLIDLVEHFTQSTYEKVRNAITNEEGPFKKIIMPQILDMAPRDKFWAIESKWMHGLAPASFLSNWIIKGNIDLNSFLNLPKNSQLDLLQNNAYLVDPFANSAVITEKDKDLWLHQIPPYNKGEFQEPTGTWGSEDSERYNKAFANLKPAFLRQYQQMAELRGAKPINSGNFILVDGLTVEGPGRQVWTVPDNLDPKVFRERYTEVGLYAINGGKIGFVNEQGKKFVGDNTLENIDALKKAGYKRGEVWVILSHGEEIKAA